MHIRFHNSFLSYFRFFSWPYLKFFDLVYVNNLCIVFFSIFISFEFHKNIFSSYLKLRLVSIFASPLFWFNFFFFFSFFNINRTLILVELYFFSCSFCRLLRFKCNKIETSFSSYDRMLLFLLFFLMLLYVWGFYIFFIYKVKKCFSIKDQFFFFLEMICFFELEYFFLD